MSKKKHIKELPSPPTTEIISMMMIREIEKVLRATGVDVRLVHFELWETPTNFVTT
jgi:6-pyruvoyl tetrahydropterin synthase